MKVTLCFVMLAILAASAIAETGSQLSPLDDAKRLISENNCSQAIPILEEIAASDPTSAAQALGMMGRCYSKQGNWSKAIESFERLLAGYPDSVAPNREVRSWIMDCYLANSQADEALALRKELLNDFQQDAWKLYYVIGRRYVWRQEFSKAIPELEKAAELGVNSQNDPDILDANSRLLHCYVQEKRWTKAKALAGILANDYPDKACEWNYEMGRCWQGIGDHVKATESLEIAVELAPENASNLKAIRKALFISYDMTGKLDKAISLAEKMVVDYPDEPTWCWELGRHYVDNEDYDEALPFFKKVIASSSKRWEIRSSQQYLARCLFKLGRGAEALAGLDSYYKDKPELWDEYLLAKAATAFYGSEDYANCLLILQELIAQVYGGKQSALVPTARELAYKALKRAGNLVEAAALLERMAVNFENPTWLLYLAGEDYYNLRNYVEAERIYNAVLDRDQVPSGIRARCMYSLALCYWNTGRKEDAKRLMQDISDKYRDTELGTKAQDWLRLWSLGKL